LQVMKHIGAPRSQAPAGIHNTPNDGGKKVPTVEDILGAILPPREFQGPDGMTMMQLVSPQPASRLDVIQLQESLDNRLVQRRAREAGLCAVRYELHAEVFDELIRQVTVNCPERGLLLLRVRDDFRTTVASHKALYENGINFALRKAAVADEGAQRLRDTISRLKHEKAELEARKQTLQNQMDVFEKQSHEDRLAEEQKREQETEYFKKSIQQLSLSLKTETEKTSVKK